MSRLRANRRGFLASLGGALGVGAVIKPETPPAPVTRYTYSHETLCGLAHDGRGLSVGVGLDSEGRPALVDSTATEQTDRHKDLMEAVKHCRDPAEFDRRWAAFLAKWEPIRA